MVSEISGNGILKWHLLQSVAFCHRNDEAGESISNVSKKRMNDIFVHPITGNSWSEAAVDQSSQISPPSLTKRMLQLRVRKRHTTVDILTEWQCWSNECCLLGKGALWCRGVAGPQRWGTGALILEQRDLEREGIASRSMAVVLNCAEWIRALFYAALYGCGPQEMVCDVVGECCRQQILLPLLLLCIQTFSSFKFSAVCVCIYKIASDVELILLLHFVLSFLKVSVVDV